jgi:hypothetical protein
MNKQTKFQRLIAKQRKYLVKQGFKASILTLWAQGKRNPKKRSAVQLSIALNLPLKEIPYIIRQYTVNK